MQIRGKLFLIWMAVVSLVLSSPFVSVGQDLTLFDSLLNLSIKHLDDQEEDQARVTLEELARHPDFKKEDTLHMQYLRVYASYLSRTEQYGEQFEQLKKYGEIAEKLEDKKWIAEYNICMAGYYEQFSDLKKATPYFLKALDFFVELRDETRIAYLYNKLGLIYYADEDYKKAQTYFFASFVLFNKYKHLNKVNAYWIQNNLANIGLCLNRQNMRRRALAYMFIAHKYCETAPFSRERPLSVIKTNIGSIYGDMGMFHEAENYLVPGIEGCLNPKNMELEHGIESLIYLARLYLRFGNSHASRLALDRAHAYINNNRLTGIYPSYLEANAEYFAHTGNFQKAYLERSAFLTIKDSLDRQMGKSAFARQILLHNLEKQKMENQLLIKEGQVRSLEIKGIYLLAFLFLIIIAIIYVGLSRERSRNKELQELNNYITSQKTSLQQLNLQLENVNVNRSIMVQSIAHDLRTPIGNVISLNGLLEDLVEEGEEGKKYLSLIDSSCQLALSIIEDILDQSMLESGKLKLVKENVKIATLLQDCISLMKFRSEPKAIEIQLLVDDPCEVFVDADRIKRVYLNILMNAIKFSPRNSVITIQQRKIDNTCVVSFTDRGIGMSEGMLKQIFDRHTLAGREGLQKEKTIGIGLSITKSLVEEHGGKIKVDSSPDSGSTFYVELPLHSPTT